MRFDVTTLDLKLLLRALILNAEPKGFGIVEYIVKKDKNLLVDSISDDDYEFYMYDFKKSEEGHFRILDYYQGKPIKFDVLKKLNGQILVDSSAFDSRIGRYKFFEILIGYFEAKDFKIVKKGYSYNDFPETDSERVVEIKSLKKINANLIPHKNQYGRYWVVDESKIKFQSEFDKHIN